MHLTAQVLPHFSSVPAPVPLHPQCPPHGLCPCPTQPPLLPAAAGLLAADGMRPGQVAALLCRQLARDAGDESLLRQAVKCLVFLAPHMRAADLAAGRLRSTQLQLTLWHRAGPQRPSTPERSDSGAAAAAAASPPEAAGPDAAQGEAEADRTEGQEAADAQSSGLGLSLAAMVQRMGRMGDDRYSSYTCSIGLDT